MADEYISTTTFTLPANLSPFTAPLKTFQESYDGEASLVVGAFIFSYGHPNSLPSHTDVNGERAAAPSAQQEPRMLLLYRASADAYGDLWDFPGGSCEPSDATLLDAVKREVFEETGLRVSEVVGCVGLHTWEEDLKKGNRKWVKFSFLVNVGVGADEFDNGGFPRIKLAEREHQGFMWATEAEIRASLEKREGAMEFIAMEEIEIAAEAFRMFNGETRKE
jgi:8-oxo-dGTP pyrophosphatase MutT (NUDIX family)